MSDVDPRDLRNAVMIRSRGARVRGVSPLPPPTAPAQSASASRFDWSANPNANGGQKARNEILGASIELGADGRARLERDGAAIEIAIRSPRAVHSIARDPGFGNQLHWEGTRLLNSHVGLEHVAQVDEGATSGSAEVVFEVRDQEGRTPSLERNRLTWPGVRLHFSSIATDESGGRLASTTTVGSDGLLHVTVDTTGVRGNVVVRQAWRAMKIRNPARGSNRGAQ